MEPTLQKSAWFSNLEFMNQGPIAESFARDRHEETSAEGTTRLETDVEATFMYVCPNHFPYNIFLFYVHRC